MARIFEIGIIGLGKFGFYLGNSLMDMGQKVVGIDSDDEKIKKAQDVLTQVFKADATDHATLAQLGLSELQYVIVSVGHSMEASILISMHLLELGVPWVLVKAMSNDHEKVLRKVGVQEIIIPERDAADQLAKRLAVPGLIEYLPLGKGVMLQELVIDHWDGKTLKELDLTNEYNVQVVAVRKKDQETFDFVPRATQIFEKGDILAVIGRDEDLAQLEP